MRIAAAAAIAGATVWTVALIASPLLRTDLDPLTAHPEAYATGPWAGLMRAGYVGLAASAAACAYVARGHRIGAVLLVVFAAGALLIGLLPPAGEGTLGDRLFPYAQLAPLAFLAAVAWVSWRERRRALLGWAGLVWLLFVPLAMGDPPFGAILNRAADLAMAAWLVVFATTARRGTTAGRAPAAQEGGDYLAGR